MNSNWYYSPADHVLFEIGSGTSYRIVQSANKWAVGCMGATRLVYVQPNPLVTFDTEKQAESALLRMAQRLNAEEMS